MGRIMAVDLGARTAGIALSDVTGLIASPLETVTRAKEGQLRPTLRRLTELVRSYDTDRIIIGLPLHMDGSESERATKSREFAALLTRRLESEGLATVTVELWDERLTSVEADEVLRESGVALCDRKRYIDKIAAALILEDYLSSHAARGEG